MSLKNLTTRPAFHDHDCDQCIRMASVEMGEFQLDVYDCPKGSAVVRYGAEGAYWSTQINLVKTFGKDDAFCLLWRTAKKFAEMAL